MEADTIGSTESCRKVLSDRGFKLSFTKDMNLMIATRGALQHDEDSRAIELLVDSSRNFDRESLPEKLRTPRDIQYAIWEIDMGIDERRTHKYGTQKFIVRSGMQKVRVLLYHRHHEYPKAHAAGTVSSIMFMWRDAIEYEVDIIAGDANQAAWWFRKD